MEQYDLIIIGSGPGGYVCAIRAAQLGLKVCCVEKGKTLGGTCLNVGCIPSKALLHTSQLYSDTKHYADLGINIDSVKLDLSKMMKSKDNSVAGLTDGIQFLFKKNKITHIKGFAKITEQNEVTILNDDGNQIINGKNIVIATGSEVAVPDDVIIDEKDILSSTGALSLDKVPEKLVVIGAGYIGLEMGSVWSRLGSKVTVIEYAERIVPNMDIEISKQFQKILIKQGIDFKLSTSFKKINNKNGKLHVLIETQQGQTSEISCDKVLISIGRKPYTFGLNLEAVGIETDERGFIKTLNNFQTSVSNIYAIGDCKLGPMLAHKASEEGTALAEILVGQAGHINFDTIPSVVYTSPEVASVGKTEEELKEANINYKVGKFPFTANAKAKVMHATEGFVKILSDASSDKVLGVHMIGADVGNMIAELALAMEFGASSEDIARTCHAHPTLTESIKEAALNVDNRAIHV
jgi:dihydrolipoamide dehydrogenase|tara:strand:- start:238 stop:1632 length:1395 start_codon:yes stop_codon:yes gene_type:complete